MVATDSERLDHAFETLSDGQRRRMLHYLSESTDSTATVRELIELLGGDSHRTEVRLRHVHIPRLRASGVADYDERTETVRYRDNPFLERLLECCHEECRSPNG